MAKMESSQVLALTLHSLYCTSDGPRALHHGKKWKWETCFGKPNSKSDPERFEYIFLMQIASTFK